MSESVVFPDTNGGYFETSAITPAYTEQPLRCVAEENVNLIPSFEADLTGPDAERLASNDSIDLFVRMEDAYPVDPGYLSGVSLRITGSGNCACLQAEFAAIQPGGHAGSHTIGFLNFHELAFMASAPESAALSFDLREQYEDAESELSGATLAINTGEDRSIRVSFGRHCLGVIRGQALAYFLHFARFRSGLEG